MHRQPSDWRSPDHPVEQERVTGPLEEKAPVASLVIINGPGFSRSFELVDRFYRIGRSPCQDIQLPDDDSVSRENHALIGYDQQRQRFAVFDGGKVNPVWVNKELVKDSRFLESGDVVRIGETDLRLTSM